MATEYFLLLLFYCANCDPEHRGFFIFFWNFTLGEKAMILQNVFIFFGSHNTFHLMVWKNMFVSQNSNTAFNGT